VRHQSPTWALPDFTEEIGVERREKRYLVIELTSGWYGWRFLEAVGYWKYAQMRCKRRDGPTKYKGAAAETADVSIDHQTSSHRCPVCVDRLPPCNHACPAGEKHPSWLLWHKQLSTSKTWWKYMDNPLPGTHGRACYHPCERFSVDDGRQDPVGTVVAAILGGHR
jgi:hypothetical protein